MYTLESNLYFLLFGTGLLQVDLLSVVVLIFVRIHVRVQIVITVAQEEFNSLWEHFIGNSRPDLFNINIISQYISTELTSNGSFSSSKKLKKLPGSAGSSSSESVPLSRGYSLVNAFAGSFQSILMA